jgi:hypothetical protein
VTEKSTSIQKGNNQNNETLTDEEIEDWFNKRLEMLKDSRAIMRAKAYETRNDVHSQPTTHSTAKAMSAIDSYLIDVFETLKEVIKKVNAHDQEFQNRKPTWDYFQKAMEHTKETLEQGR